MAKLDHNAPEFERNYGFWSREEQQRLIDSRVAIAGVGGDGYQLGIKLAMMGVGSLVVADPEDFEIENSNRVLGATRDALGVNKAVAFKQAVEAIRPKTEVIVFEGGVTLDNSAEFMEGAHLVLDESELTKPAIGVTIAQEARRQKIPNLILMNIGFAAVATAFDPHGHRTFERMMGFADGVDPATLQSARPNFSRCLPYVPPYGDAGALRSVIKGVRPLPSISPGVDVASGLGTTEAFLHLVGDVSNHRPSPTWNPHWRYLDAYTGRAGTIRSAKLGYYAGVAQLLVRNALRKNPKVDYGPAAD